MVLSYEATYSKSIARTLDSELFEFVIFRKTQIVDEVIGLKTELKEIWKKTNFKIT